MLRERHLGFQFQDGDVVVVRASIVLFVHENLGYAEVALMATPLIEVVLAQTNRHVACVEPGEVKSNHLFKNNQPIVHSSPRSSSHGAYSDAD